MSLQKRLLNEAEKGNVPELEALLQNHNDIIGYRDPQGDTALHKAALKGQEQAIQVLLKYGASVNVQNDQGQTPLWIACYWMHVSSIKLLLDNGADMCIAATNTKIPGESWGWPMGPKDKISNLLEEKRLQQEEEKYLQRKAMKDLRRRQEEEARQRAIEEHNRRKEEEERQEACLLVKIAIEEEQRRKEEEARQQAIREEKRLKEERRVKAVNAVNKARRTYLYDQILKSKFPMHCCTVDGLLTLTKLIPHEEALQKNILAVIDVSTPVFQILFISHKWLTDNHPDDLEGSKLVQIKKMLGKHPMREIKYVWLDYFSIPQNSQEDLQRAIHSLPFYINSCGLFVSLVGEGGLAAQVEYDKRGWCRLECFAANSPVDPNSRAKMYIHNKDTNKLEAILQSFTKTEAQSNPLEGDFTDDGDRAKISQILIFLTDIVEINPNDDVDREVARYIRLSAIRQLAIQALMENIKDIENQMSNQRISILQIEQVQVTVDSVLRNIPPAQNKNSPRFPCHVMPKKVFLTLSQFMKFEDALKRGFIQIIDQYVPREAVMFFSHKWLSDHHPDDNWNSKHKQVKRVVCRDLFAKVEFIWMDYQSVPQDNGELQKLAIASLATYVSRCAHFVSLLGETGLATCDIYNSRGWCRLEKYAVRPSLTEHVQIYEHVKETDKLKKLPISFNSCSDANPLEGVFTEEQDKYEIAPTLIQIAADKINDPYDDKIIEIAEHIIVSAQTHLNNKKIQEIEQNIISLEQNLGEEKAFITSFQDKQGVVMSEEIIVRASKVSKSFRQHKITRLWKMKLKVDSEVPGLDEEVATLAYQMLEDEEEKTDFVSQMIKANEKKNYLSSQGHHFELKSFSKPTWCFSCQKILLGVFKQGYHCNSCGISVHDKCRISENVDFICKGKKQIPHSDYPKNLQRLQQQIPHSDYPKNLQRLQQQIPHSDYPKNPQRLQQQIPHSDHPKDLHRLQQANQKPEAELRKAEISPVLLFGQVPWNCAQCTFKNAADLQACTVCYTPKVEANQNFEMELQEADTSPALLVVQVPWNCSQCTLENASHLEACAVCYTPNAKANQKHEAELPKADTSPALLVVQIPWNCAQCTLENAADLEACAVCYTPKAEYVVQVPWNCVLCTLENAADRNACDGCGEPKAEVPNSTNF